MSNLMYGVLLKVNDIDQCRMFYRDIIGFGTPFFDSSFMVQFALAENLVLTLEQNSGKFLEHASSATGWFFETEDIDALSARLQDSGFPALSEIISFGTSEYRIGRDPENNIFYVRQRS